MQRNQKHHKEGYVTQNQLVAILRQDEFVRRCNEQGIMLKKEAVRILKNKIKQLRGAGKIPYQSSANAIHYKQEDILKIAKVLADFKNN